MLPFPPQKLKQLHLTTLRYLIRLFEEVDDCKSILVNIYRDVVSVLWADDSALRHMDLKGRYYKDFNLDSVGAIASFPIDEPTLMWFASPIPCVGADRLQR